MPLLTVLTQLDVRTISFMVSIATLLQVVMIAFQLDLKQQYQGIHAALAGNLCGAAGFLLFSLRGSLSPLFTILIANTLIVGSVSLIYVANSQFTETRYRRWVAILPPLLTLPLLYFFTYRYDNLVIRTATVSLLSVLPMALTAYTLYAHIPDSYHRAARLTAFTYSLYTLLTLGRGLGVFLIPPQAVFEQSPAQVISFIGIFILGNLWTIGFILMINQRLYSDMHAMATTDYLTHLLNRRAMMKMMQAEEARSRRNEQPFSLLLIDIDHFKGINDTHGHLAGDQVLVEVSRIFKSIMRTNDYIARWGGEEFLVMLPETALEQALVVAERLRSAVATASFFASPNKPGPKISTSISIGVAGTVTAGSSFEKMLSLADEGLYQAKQKRNSVKSVQLEAADSLTPG